MGLFSKVKKAAKKVGGAVSKPIRSVGRAVDVTAKKSAIRGGLRTLDKKVGGAQGWGKLAQVGGTVVAATGLGVGVGATIAAVGKGLQAKGAMDDAKREERRFAEEDRKAEELYQKELAAWNAKQGKNPTPLSAIGSEYIAVPDAQTVGAASSPALTGSSSSSALPLAVGAAAVGALVLGPVGLAAGVVPLVLARKAG